MFIAFVSQLSLLSHAIAVVLTWRLKVALAFVLALMCFQNQLVVLVLGLLVKPLLCESKRLLNMGSPELAWQIGSLDTLGFFRI